MSTGCSGTTAPVEPTPVAMTYSSVRRSPAVTPLRSEPSCTYHQVHSLQMTAHDHSFRGRLQGSHARGDRWDTLGKSAPCSAGVAGHDAVVLTVDAAGRACLWQEPSGTLLCTAQTQLQPVAGGALLLPGLLHAAVPCHLAGRSADGGAVNRAVEQQGVAVLDLQTLEVVDVAAPASLMSLQKFWNAGVL